MCWGEYTRRTTHRSPNEARVGTGVDNGQCRGLLFLGLATSRANPAENDGVDGIGSNRKDDHGEISRAGIEGGTAEDKAEDGDGLCDSNMPGSFVVFTGRSTPEDGDETGNEVGWAGEDEGDGAVEAEGFDGGGEEVLEAIGSQVHVLHKGKEPELGVASGILETGKSAGAGFATDGVTLDAIMGQLAFFGGEPAGGERVVRKGKDSTDGNDEGGNTLDDKEPAPAGKTSDAIHLEDSESNKSSESSCKDVASIQDGNAGGNLFASVEDGEHKQGSRVVWGFGDTQEEASEKQASEILGDGGQGADDGPESHEAGHVV